MFKKVIVGVDFTENTERVVGIALNLAKSTQGTTVLLHVSSVTNDTRKGTTGSATDVMHTIEARLRDEAAKLAADHQATVDYGVVEGNAADEIVKYIQKWGGDVVVVGTNGRKGIDRILIGSVAERLLLVSPVPVLVVGPGVF